PARRRPGLPEDVAALVETLQDGSTSLILVNLNQADPRTVIVQGGAYGEHLCEQVTAEGRTTPVPQRALPVGLPPRCGGRITITMKRYASQPTLAQPSYGE